jgi:hypothetical protein
VVELEIDGRDLGKPRATKSAQNKVTKTRNGDQGLRSCRTGRFERLQTPSGPQIGPGLDRFPSNDWIPITVAPLFLSHDTGYTVVNLHIFGRAAPFSPKELFYTDNFCGYGLSCTESPPSIALCRVRGLDLRPALRDRSQRRRRMPHADHQTTRTHIFRDCQTFRLLLRTNECLELQIIPRRPRFRTRFDVVECTVAFEEAIESSISAALELTHVLPQVISGSRATIAASFGTVR